MLPHQLSIRKVTLQDCAVILHHRRSMFRDMAEGTPEELDQMVEASAPWLTAALADGSYQGWLAQDGQGKVVAGGGVLISTWPPRPRDSNARRAVIFNVYTEPEFRQRGLARELMLLMIGWLREQGFRSVVLHASDAGRHLYETLGFQPTHEMRLRLD
jgi:ribosomal protein S18 acetylase RimI-like enzyme